MAKGKAGKKTGSLSQEMDDKVYNLIVSLLDFKGQELKSKYPNEQDPYKTIAFAKDLTGQEIYLYIKQKDKSFSRVKDAHLKYSIDRVWKVFKDEEYEEIQSMGLDPNTLEEQNESDVFNEEDLMDVKDTNKANKSITDLWKLSDNNNLTQSETEKESKPVEEVANNNEENESKKSKKRTTGTKDSNKPSKRMKANKDRTPPSITLNTLGGLDDIIPQLMEVVGMPILHPEIYVSMGIQPPRGVLLHGPPGCGKTTIANALAGELQVPFISLSAPSVVSGMSGESEKKVREIFEEARQLAPCLVFFDEIDAITPKRDGGAQREMERRIVAQLLTSMDELSLEKTDGKPVIVIGATNRPDSLDSALRRAGRFDREICINVPNELSRHNILSAMTKNLKTSGSLDLMKLAKMTPGFVGADLKALVTASGITAIKRIFSTLSGEQEKVLLTEPEISEIPSDPKETIETENGNGFEEQPTETVIGDEMDLDEEVPEVIDESVAATPIPQPSKLNTLASLVDSNVDFDSLPTIQKFLLRHPSPLTPEQLENLTIIEDDFLEALPTIQPTAKREGFATIPDVTWSSIGALHKVRDELNMAIVHPIKTPEIYKRVGIDSPAGVLMWGPPGCGKTLLAKAVANESKANFISVKGPELLNKYVGESEKAVRQVFARARASVPCIIFFDELDALVPRRDTALSESSSRVVNTLLTELDGLNDRKGIFVVGATNRPEMIDPAMLRPGRLDKSLYIELPTADERYDILRTVIKINNTPVHDTVDLYSIAHDERCRNFSGADLSSLVREAGVSTLRRVFGDNKNIGNGMVTDGDFSSGDIYVTIDDFEVALSKVKPSVSDEDRKDYDLRNKTLGSERKN